MRAASLLCNEPAEAPTDGRQAAIGHLAVLPVFLDLSGRRAVVIGGTRAAAWKAELLAAAGAHVVVFAEVLSDEMRGVLGDDDGGGPRRAGPASLPDCLAGAALAVADVGDDAEAVAIRRAAKTAGVPLNVIDRPAYCDLQFGSIVNRSPVVIGISTHGAAPVLGQAIRCRIEAVLPPWLSRWGGLAKRLRATVSGGLESARDRRRFWEYLSDRAFRAAPGENTESELIRAVSRIQQGGRQTGGVTLVGSGPGEAEHLTLKAVRALQSADVILCDDTIHCDVLELARREARRVVIGHDPIVRDRSRDMLALALARAGERVVLLEKGNPATEGDRRLATLRRMARGIPVALVPGVSDGIEKAAQSADHGVPRHPLRLPAASTPQSTRL